MTPPDRFSLLQEVFHEAKALTGPARAAFLFERCGGDDVLRAEIDSLLREHDAGTEHFLLTPALRSDLLGDAPGALDGTPPSISGYALKRRLGTGGMGVVYLAEQLGTRRTVALKIMRPGFATTSMLRRFEQEARLLGRLRHPGIAQVFEAGVHGDDENGAPFIAMELIEGPPLLEFAERERLDVRARLALFLPICDAVQHAHLRGVIHRDLKPRNILVEAPGADDTSEAIGRPKVLDFGIARATDADVQATTMRTNMGELIGTIPYMSPEQAAGDPAELDVRSDVYALGVILYQLVSGRLPYDIERKPIHEAVRVVREVEAMRLASVDRTFRGDLDTILGKALEKEPERRYASAADLASDLRQFLRNGPIAAHRPSRTYQLRKFARRNRGLVAGGLAGFVLLVAGLVTTTWLAIDAENARDAEREQRERAEDRLADVRRLANAFVFDVYNELKDVPGTLAARRLLVETGLRYLDRVAAETAQEDPALLVELASAYMRIGDIQGDPQRPSLGDMDGAAESYEKATGLLEALPALNDRAGEMQVLSYLKRGDLHLPAGEIAEALVLFEHGLAAAERRAAERPAPLRTQRDVSLALDRYGSALIGLGRTEEGRECIDRAWTIVRDLTEAHPDDEGLQRDLAVRLFRAAGRDRAAGRLDTALAQYREYLAISERLAEAQPHSAVNRHDVAAGHERVGALEAALGNDAAAIEHYERAIEIGEVLAAADPSDVGARAALCAPYCWLGDLHMQRGRSDEAIIQYRHYYNSARTAAAIDPRNGPLQRDLGVALYKLGDWSARRAAEDDRPFPERDNLWREARRWFGESRDTFFGMRERGLLMAADAGVPEEIAAEVARCDDALQALAARRSEAP